MARLLWPQAATGRGLKKEAGTGSRPRRLRRLERYAADYFCSDAVQIGLPSAPLKSCVHDASICCTTAFGSGT